MKKKTKQPKKLKKEKPQTASYHHGNLRESLIQVALKFLEKNPVEKLSLRTLASLAGVSQAAPYRHFKDRNEVLAAISQQGFELKFEYMKKAFEKHRDNPLELYHACADAYFQMGFKHPQHFKLMLSSHVKPCKDYPELLRAAAMGYALVKKMIDRGQKAGVVGPGDPYHKALHCWSVVTGFTTLFAEGRLVWIGVTNENASQALRALVEQFRLGNSQALVKTPHSFAPFCTDESKESLERLKQVEAALSHL